METTKNSIDTQSKTKKLKKLLSHGESTDLKNLKAEQLVFYFVRWIQLNDLLQGEFLESEYSTDEVAHYRALKDKFETEVKPQLIQYKKFLNSQDPKLVQEYFGVKIQNYLELSNKAHNVNDQMEVELLEQAQIFCRIYQSSIPSSILKTAQERITTQLQKSHPSYSEPETPPTPIFSTLGDQLQTTLSEVRKWGTQTLTKVQQTAQTTAENLKHTIDTQSQVMRERRIARINKREADLFHKFEELLSISRKMLIRDVCWHLKISRRKLMEELKKWKKEIDFTIDGKFLRFEPLEYFSSKLDDLFQNWNEQDYKNSKN